MKYGRRQHVPEKKKGREAMQKLYYGGDIITMEKEEDAPEAVLVSDGKIVYVGGLEEAKQHCGPLAEQVDLKGRALMPSFIDPHGHIGMMAQYTAFANLGACTDFEEIAKALQEYRAEKARDVIIGYGYDHNFLKEQEHPTKAVLDKVSDTIPVCILHTSGHMCAANSVLLKECGITKETKDPEGGKFGRDADGEPNGYIEEVPAMAKVLMSVFSKAKAEFGEQMELAQQAYLKYGITTVQDGATNGSSFQNFASYAETGGFCLDVVAYLLADEADQVIKEFPAYENQYQGHLKIGGEKIILDGSPQGRSAWLSKPYEGEESYCGYPACTEGQVRQWVEDAVTAGRQILAHCNGDAASQQYLDAFFKIAKESPECLEKIRALRPVMIHCQTVREDQLEEMARLGMIPSIFVAHTYYWGDVHLKNLGPVRGANISPVKSALECGLIYNFHQDPPVVEPDMLRTVWCAVNRITRTGQAIGPEQRISVFEALRGVTIHAAYAYHEEGHKGTLTAGKLADLVILDRNPLKTDPMQIRDIKVLETIKEGKTLYQKDTEG